MFGRVDVMSTLIYKSSMRVYTTGRFERHIILICTHAVQWCGHNTHIYIQTTVAAANWIDGKFGPFSLNGTRYVYWSALTTETVRRKRKTMASGKLHSYANIIPWFWCRICGFEIVGRQWNFMEIYLLHDSNRRTI